MSNKFNLPILSDLSLSAIAFAMENQDDEYVFCLNDGNVYLCENLGEYFDNPDEMEFEDLPKWTSADGYRLMCAFAQSCKDGNLRYRLNDILNSSGHGVFKRFRAVLDTVDGATDAWYKFKDKRMYARIRAWYRKIMANRPSFTTEKENADDSETGSLMVSYDVEHLEKLDSRCLELEKLVLGDQKIASKVLSAFTNREALCACQDGRLCGMLSFEVVGDVACLLIYYIEEESRGIGLFEMLFDLMNRDLERRGVQKVLFPLQANSKMEEFLSNRGVPSSLAYNIKEYKVKSWNGEVDSQEIAYLV